MNPTTLRSVYRKVERTDKHDLVAALLPQVFQWARAVDPVQPLTSGVWQGTWGDPDDAARSRHPARQLRRDHLPLLCQARPSSRRRIAELAPLRRPILCTEYLARPLGSTSRESCRLPSGTTSARSTGVWSRARPRRICRGIRGITRTRDPEGWFSDLLRPDGRPYRDSDVRTLRNVTPLLHAK